MNRGRRRFPLLLTIVFLLALGGAITLVAEPFFPEGWTAWIADAQDQLSSAR